MSEIYALFQCECDYYIHGLTLELFMSALQREKGNLIAKYMWVGKSLLANIYTRVNNNWVPLNNSLLSFCLS